MVLGGGLAGLTCARDLAQAGADVLVHEAAAGVGGTAATDHVGGFSFDRTGHWLHLRDAGIRSLVEELLGGALLEVERRARIWTHGVLLHYPFQANLHGLPPEVVRDCLLGFVEALGRRAAGEPPPEDFDAYIRYHLGDGIARSFMVPYNAKMWGTHPSELTAAWCARFVPRPTLEEVVSGAVGCIREGIGYNPRLVYPLAGGIGLLAEALAAGLPGRVLTSRRARRVDPRGRRVLFDDGWRGYDRLVSTLPMPSLVGMLDGAPEEVARASGRLRFATVAYVNYGCRGEVNRGLHWVYVPEERYPFYRVGSYSNVAPHLAPEGHGSLYVETTLPGGETPDWSSLLPRVRAGLVEAGLLPSEDRIVVEDPRTVPVAYVLFDRNHAASRATVAGFLDEHGIESIGRYGGWTYGSMEDAMLDGRATASRLAATRGEA